MRVLVIGASGQVGRALCAAFAPRHTVIAASHQHVEQGQRSVDLADGASIAGLWLDVRPDLVLLAGGMCNVDGCELEPDLCLRVNVAGTQAVADQARATDAAVVFLSTDHVFDGSRDFNRETDPVAPIYVYADSKVQAEEILRRCLPGRHLILRTSGVYGVDAYRRNFVLRLVDRIRQGEQVTVPEDQWGSPTFAEDLARAALVLVTRGETGTFHATSPDFVSRIAFARLICQHFELDSSLLVPRPTSSLGQAAKRPLKVRLDCRKIGEAGVDPFQTIDAGLDRLRALLEPVAERSRS
jgi:dTDP-4-dehydrorhamnose reductase